MTKVSLELCSQTTQAILIYTSILINILSLGNILCFNKSIQTIVDCLPEEWIIWPPEGDIVRL